MAACPVRLLGGSGGQAGVEGEPRLGAEALPGTLAAWLGLDKL